ncbi:MAG: hypothetical protein KGD60_08605 [Candidatus Thorarchaeota archaeon]|nr:hypothetical protein [Candidatus Thorarchaeota archaeon]
MSFVQTPLYWLIDIEGYDFHVGAFKDADLKGKALILSNQLWSIIRGTRVLSVLIGPGIFKGVATKGSIQVDVLEYLSALMFDPTMLRFDEPLPQVDIVGPEVIDPLGVRKQEEIVTIIRNLVMEKGNILAADRLATVQTETNVPQTAHYEEIFKRINVSHVSGLQRAKFILAGTNGPLYKPFVEYFESRKFWRKERTKVMATPFHKFSSFVDIDVMSDWMIVEKAGMDSKTGMEAIGDEFERTLTAVERERESFIFEL